ncbi:MAG: right-handed parallel beta-helix repeat-containing protein [Planctomycetota bacterium]|nr:right-handed parallel beta-helix repeat-containing protein [Planctomycetota bacterium]
MTLNYSMPWQFIRNTAVWSATTFAVLVIATTAYSADYYLANKPGSGAGTKDDPFGLADLPKPDNRPTRALAVLQPGDTLWFKGGEYSFDTGPVKDFYHVGYLRPARSGEAGKPISFQACPSEKVVLSAASGGQPIFGNGDRDYVRHQGFIIHGTVGHMGGKGAEIAYCEIIGQYVDTSDNHDGLRIEHADGAWVHHNIIHGVQGKSGNSAGIKVYKSQNLIIEDNWIYDNTRGIFDKDSGINNTYRRNFLSGNRQEQFHGNNQGKYMVAHIYDNVIDGHVALGYLVDGSDVHNNLIRGDMLAGHWAGEVWNTRLWNNIVIASGKAITAYNESKNRFVETGEKKHLAYMDYNLYTAPPKYTFGAYSKEKVQAFGLDEMRSRGIEQHSQVLANSSEIYKDQKSWELLPKWKTAGRDGNSVGPEDVALVLDVRRYGPAARGR